MYSVHVHVYMYMYMYTIHMILYMGCTLCNIELERENKQVMR